MRIALLGPIAWRVPPRHYGPWEQLTSLLAAVAAVGRADGLDSCTIRSVAASRFGAERMVGDYVEAYASLLERPQ